MLKHPGAMAGTLKAGTDMSDATRLNALDFDDAIAACCVALEAGWTSTNQARRVLQIVERFASFARLGFGIDDLVDVSPMAAERFIAAPTPDSAAPSVALQHLRRSALRFLFRAARHNGLDVGDPTLDVRLPPRSPLSTRPLTDDEVLLCRSSAYWSLIDSRRAAAWALAEATCRSSELPHILVQDIDLDRQLLRIHGGRTTNERVSPLGEWSFAQIARRIDELEHKSDMPLVYAGDGGGQVGQISSCIAISDVLTRSGLGAEPDVRPASVAGWAGCQILAETGRVDEVARRLGMASLDRTARFIAWDWKSAEADVD